MNKNQITLLVLLLTCYFGFSQDISGVYITDFNEMTLSNSGNKVIGTYKHKNGHIEGILNGLTLTGLWSQDNGRGNFVFVFNSDFSKFTGKWAFNDSPPANKWNGTKIRGTEEQVVPRTININGVYDTNFGEMSLNQHCDEVTGSYEYQNGHLKGTLHGNTLTGSWFQNNGKGTFVFVFNSDFSEFTGSWGLNDALPANEWNGTKIIWAEQSLTLNGDYDTDFGELSLSQSQNCDKVRGRYRRQNGRIEGILHGTVLTGSWFQDNGKGNFVFVFDSDFSAFKGKWAYNDAYPTIKWDGIKK